MSRTRRSMGQAFLAGTLVSLLGLSGGGLLGGGSASAQGRAPAKKAAKKADGAKADDKGSEGSEAKSGEGGEGESPKVKVERGAGGKKVYVIKTGFVIEGRIQKPNAFYVLQRSQINYDWAALKQRFVPRILDAVTQSPF
jgi:hypothetical protein